MPSELCSNALWWHGPSELKTSDFSTESFNVKDASVINNIEIENVQTVNCNVVEEVLPISKYSSIAKLQRVVAYLLRFIKNCRLKKHERAESKLLDVNEYRLSKQAIVKHVQCFHFHDDIKCIKNGKTVKSNLKKLCLFIDSDGLLRVGGRLENANIPYSQKHPLILPKKCNFTKLIIRDEHIILLHAGLKLTLSSPLH